MLDDLPAAATSTVMYWMGRNVEDLSKPELILALKILHGQMVGEREARKSVDEMYELARKGRQRFESLEMKSRNQDGARR
jgi:hypothetical protein